MYQVHKEVGVQNIEWNRHQCDQIWRKFATMAKLYKHLAIFSELVIMWQHFESTLANFYGNYWPNVHGWKGQILKHWSRWSARKWKMSELPDSPGLALAIEILLINKFESSIRDFFFSAVIRFCFEWKLMKKKETNGKRKKESSC